MDEYNIEYAMKDAPVYTLREQLAQRDYDTLREIAAEPELDINPALDKDTLAGDIAVKLSEPETLRKYLLVFSRREIDFFRECAGQREMRKAGINISHFGHAYFNGLMTLYYGGGEIFCVMPEEIQATFGRLEQTSFPAEWNRRELLRTYGRAAVELYGVILITDVVAIFNDQNEEPTTVTEFVRAINEVYSDLSSMVAEEEYLINNAVLDDAPWDEIEHYAEEASRKPRYIPSDEEMLTVGEAFCTPDTPQKLAVEEFLRSESQLSNGKIEDIAFELQNLFQTKPWRLNDVTRILHDVTVKMDVAQVERLMPLIMDMSNNTRTWLNNGHTPNELHKLMDSGDLPALAKPILYKVGRNDPCPCGSGKKFKRCCGR